MCKTRAVVQFFGREDSSVGLVPLSQLSVRVLGYFPQLEHIGYSAAVVQGQVVLGGCRFNTRGFHLAGITRAVHADTGQSLVRDEPGRCWRDGDSGHFVPRGRIQHLFFDKSDVQRQHVLRCLGKPLEVDYDIDQAKRLLNTKLVLDAGRTDVCDFVNGAITLLHSRPLTAELSLPPFYAVTSAEAVIKPSDEFLREQMLSYARGEFSRSLQFVCTRAGVVTISDETPDALNVTITPGADDAGDEQAEAVRYQLPANTQLLISQGQQVQPGTPLGLLDPYLRPHECEDYKQAEAHLRPVLEQVHKQLLDREGWARQLPNGQVAYPLRWLTELPPNAQVYVDLHEHDAPQAVQVGRYGRGLIGSHGSLLHYNLFATPFRRNAMRRINEARSASGDAATALAQLDPALTAA